MRYLYVIGDVFVKAGTPVGGDTPALLAPNQTFTVWNQDSSGVQVTDLTAKDGVSPLTLDSATGNPVADGNGVPPWFRGPDVSVPTMLYADTGVGPRIPLYPLEALVLAFQNAVAGTSGGGGTGNVSGAALAGAEFRYVTVWENSDHTYPGRLADLGAQEAIEWVGTVAPETYGITARYDKWTRLS